jgi:hypothetical protein
MFYFLERFTRAENGARVCSAQIEVTWSLSAPPDGEQGKTEEL